MTTDPKHSLEEKNSYVAFIDILGFKKFLEEKDFKNKMGEIIYRLGRRAEYDVKNYKRIKYIAISDTIIILADEGQGYPLVRKVGQVQNAILKLGKATRGAISFGKIFTTEHGILGRNVFGDGYLEAYRNEKIGVFPKTVILESALKHVKRDIKDFQKSLIKKTTRSELDTFVLKEEKHSYVNQFSTDIIGLGASSVNRAKAIANFDKYKISISEGLRTCPKDDEGKWVWLNQEVNKYV